MIDIKNWYAFDSRPESGKKDISPLMNNYIGTGDQLNSEHSPGLDCKKKHIEHPILSDDFVQVYVKDKIFEKQSNVVVNLFDGSREQPIIRVDEFESKCQFEIDVTPRFSEKTKVVLNHFVLFVNGYKIEDKGILLAIGKGIKSIFLLCLGNFIHADINLNHKNPRFRYSAIT